MKQINIYKAFAILFFPILLFTGCLDLISESNNGEVGSEQLSLQLNINAPGIFSSVNTRSMSNEAALSDVQVLVFEELSGGSEVFRYEAPITKEAGLTYTVKVQVSQKEEKYRLVVLANAPKVTFADSDNGKSKEEILNRFSFDCAGVWNATVSNSKPIPMWGEAINTLTIKKEEYVDVLLHRALAKVDIGLMFKEQTQDKQTEEVEGLDNFKLTSVRVYRTVNKGYVASSADKFNDKNEAIKPNIHPEGIYNLGDGNSSADIKDANEKPLVYEFTPADKYVREIYIPESLEVLNGTHTMDDVPCLVVGGYYGTENNENETFYRVDFAEYEANGVIKKGTYKTLLRNHRYVVNIKSASGPGFKDPDHALNSINAKLELEVVEWNEVPMNYFVVGDYYFKINTRDVVLSAEQQVLGDGEPWDGFSVQYLKYETNLAVSKSSFTQKWESSGGSESLYGIGAFFDYDHASHKIAFVIAAPVNVPGHEQNEDADGEEKNDVVTFTVDNKFTFTIKVKQEEYRNTKYQLLCENKVVNGLYVKGKGLTNNAYIDINVKADAGSGTLTGSPYVIETNTENGIYFKAEGNFGDDSSFILDDKGESYRVRLQGFGAPTNYAESTYQITCNSSSERNTTCSVDIATAYRPIRILAISDDSRYGYGLDAPSNSYNFVSSTANFGLNPNSTVKVESVTITHTTEHDYFANQLITRPDIILCALSGLRINKVPIANLTEYINAGGVFICLHEHNFGAFIKTLPGLSKAAIDDGPINTAVLISTVDDMITNGSFGDLKGKYWGATGTNQIAQNLDANKVTVYSGNTASSTLFKHNEKNFFYCGDGGLLTNNARLGYGTHPFAVDGNAGYRPMTATYGKQTVYSAALFGNIMEWAMYQATYHGINK